MTITGQSSLSKDTIEQMVRDAEAHAEEDRRRREEAEVRNNADTLVYQTEKLLREQGDKISAEERQDVDERLTELKSALGGSDLDAIRTAFGNNKLPTVSSTKSLTGHSQGATGAHEAIYSLLMLNEDFVAASANIENLDAGAGDYPIARQRIDNAGLQSVMSNSFGFGGTNACLLFSRYDH